MGSTFDKTGGASEAQHKKMSFAYLLFCTSPDLHYLLTRQAAPRKCNIKKMSFAHLLFCTSLDLHYLCKEIPKRLKQ